MAMVQGQYSDGGSTTVLVPGAANKLIRVLRLIFTADGSAQLRLQSDPGQPGVQDLTPRIFVPSSRMADLVFEAEGGLVAERGKPLGFTVSMQIGLNYGVTLWYEIVD
jgi:hypothetical protein